MPLYHLYVHVYGEIQALLHRMYEGVIFSKINYFLKTKFSLRYTFLCLTKWCFTDSEYGDEMCVNGVSFYSVHL